MRNEDNTSIVLFVGVVSAAFIAVALIHLGEAITPVPTDLSWNPITLAIGLATGDAWPSAAGWLLGGGIGRRDRGSGVVVYPTGVQNSSGVTPYESGRQDAPGHA